MITVLTRHAPLCKEQVSTTSDFQRTRTGIIQLSKNIRPNSLEINPHPAEDGLVKAAHSSIGSKSSAKDMIIKQKIALLFHLEDALQEITDMLIEMSRKLMEEDINIMTSIKGIGDKTAAHFLIEMGGDINQYECSGKIIAMAGLDPAVHQSGKHEGKGRITKRGNRHLRRIIWLMTTSVIQYTDTFHTEYRKRRKEGLPYKMAVLATAHKLIRVI
jgi:transposase